ncbi:hypothetical protein [Streptomyces triticagri]|nr:hypothetical protein [Streptomyces triticagri]
MKDEGIDWSTIAVAVITAGPAYLTIAWQIAKDRRERQERDRNRREGQ